MAGIDDSFTNIDEMQLARAAAVELQRGTVLAGRYEIEATLGCGGAGLVLRAQDRELREAVAIKVLRADLGNAARWIDRLAREVKLARQLRHPNVCRVFDFEKAEGHVFIVMELAKGGSLRRELDDGTLLARPLEARLADARAVAAGLAAIHDAGIAHRDVTPQNVLRMGDGRVVVSDFGLATEISQTTTSIHGGTIAYMAPEVVRGQRGSFASDVWALGVVIHEIVFGERPTWSKSVGGTLVAPGGGRTLTRGERVAFAVCRACTAEEPGKRPRSARDVAEGLEGGRAATPRRQRLHIFAALLVIAASGGIVLALRAPKSPLKAANKPIESSQTIQATGEGTDWTTSSRVLTKIDGRIRCMTLLPDRRTVRFVWGTPARAEDLDTRSGVRNRSRIVPAAFAQSCPQLSPDGKRLLYEGYASDGRAFAFVSERPDGAGAAPMVPIADPSMNSEPSWLPDGRTFVVDVDHEHAGVFSLDTLRTIILPEAVLQPSAGAFHAVVGGRIVLSAVPGNYDGTEFAAFHWPIVSEAFRFRVANLTLDLMSPDGTTLLGVQLLFNSSFIIAIDPLHRTAQRLATITGQTIRHLLATDNGLVFNSKRRRTDVWTRSADAEGELRQLTHEGTFAEASPCGPDIIASLRVGSATTHVVRLDRSGRVMAVLDRTSNGYLSPSCAPDGRTWYLGRFGERTSVDRCDARGCTQIMEGSASALSVSPDGARLAFVQSRKSWPVVVWMPSSGGAIHDVATNDSNCAGGWSSARDLWISTRRNGRVRWTEINADSGKETGRFKAGSSDCADGSPDPQSPVNPQVRVVEQITSEVRVTPLPTSAP